MMTNASKTSNRVVEILDHFYDSQWVTSIKKMTIEIMFNLIPLIWSKGENASTKLG